jgi:hypothetical protein
MSRRTAPEERVYQLKRLAGMFYTMAESPSEEDMETVFDCLIYNNVPRLRAFVESFGIDTKKEM